MSTTADYVLKHQPNDFIVREVSRPPVEACGDYSYAELEKCGLTTLEALTLIASHLGIPEADVSAAGLKDEDAVTRQTVSLRADYTEPFRIGLGPQTWLRVSAPVGRYDRHLEKGALLGNDFWLVIRGLSADAAERLWHRGGSRGQFRQYVVNYFDRQRFGIPGSNYRTADVGFALLAGDVRRAAAVLHEDTSEAVARGGLIPSEQARFIQDVDAGMDSLAAFDRISSRLRLFFAASSLSRDWNLQTAQAVAATGHLLPLYDDGHPLAGCLGLTGPQALASLPAGFPLQEPIALPRQDAPAMTMRATWRPTITATKIFLIDRGPDECFPGRHKLQVFFNLPSGSYATAAVHQMIAATMTTSPADRPTADAGAARAA
ncbi:tRNA pseudouridine(13) synthase TruD [Streptomyces sp. NPDC015127]|uniref:tRNA pseudouridine(13) synthase TruD n=1 Tax=Streptomyces sp. NPDC015127 TaxID=3364939 RepID=UPI0036FCD1E0